MLTMEVTVPWASGPQAEVAYNSLRVEVEPARSKVSRTMALQGSNLLVTFRAEETRNLRVACTNFFEHVVLVAETIRLFG